MNIEQNDNEETQSVGEYLIYGAKLSRRAFLGGSGALIASLALDQNWHLLRLTAVNPPHWMRLNQPVGLKFMPITQH